MSRYRFLGSPVWIAGMIIALAAVVVFVNLGFWQLRRLDERRERNDAIVERIGGEPLALATALATMGRDPDELAYRRVVARGSYDADAEVLRIGTVQAGRSGNDVVTPLIADGFTIAVDRGWVPIDAGDPPVPGAEAPIGEVEVVGVLLGGETAGSLGSPNEEGRYGVVGRIDLEALAPQWGGEVLPVYLLLEAQDPAPGALPVPRSPPEADAGPHLSYAIQWFIFAAIVLVGFPVLVYRNAR